MNLIGPDKVSCICEGRNMACDQCLGTGCIPGRGYVSRSNETKKYIDPLKRDKKIIERCLIKYEYLYDSINGIEKRSENIELIRYFKKELESLENELRPFKHISDLKRQITDVLRKAIELRMTLHTKYDGLIKIWTVNYKIKNAYERVLQPPKARLRKLPKAALPSGKKKGKKGKTKSKKKK